MPRYPATTPAVDTVRSMTFAAFGATLARLRQEGRLVPLHLGDTHRIPPAEAIAAARLDELSSHLYCPTGGLPELVEAIAAHESRGADEVLVTPGATGGLSVVVNALFEPGDEVIVLTPSWPLIFGILQRHGATVVELEVGPDGWPDGDGLLERLRGAINERTAGIYFCHPNNPVGFVYEPALLEALAELARANDLWLIADMAYDQIVFDEVGAASLPDAVASDPRTIVVKTFSKSHGLAGHRVGYLVADKALRGCLLKVGTHFAYHTSVPGQRIAAAALREPRFVESLRATYREAAEAAAAALGDAIPFRAPQAGYYIWLDLRQACPDGESALTWLGEALEATGVALAPGAAFGDAAERFARLCYTAVPPEAMRAAVSELASWARGRGA